MNPYLKYKELFDKVYTSNEIIIDADMKEHTYFKVGGSADILLQPSKLIKLLML